MTLPIRSPRREIAALAVPVSLEMVVALVMNFINQIVVGGLGTTAIAAVGFTNSITFIAMITFGSVGGSVSIMAARAHGGGRLHELNAVVHVALILGTLVSAAFIAVPVMFPAAVLRLAGGSASVVSTGADYLRISALALLPNVASRVLSGVMRSTGHTRGPLIATSITTMLNTVLAYMFVYGAGPAPDLGVAGAAVASLVAASLNLVILAGMSYGIDRIIAWEIPRAVSGWWAVAKPLFIFAAPLALTELVWSLGGYLYNVIFQRLGDEALAAAQIVGTLEAVFILASFGLMTASTTLIGRSLGQGDAQAAREWVRRLRKTAYVTAMLFGGLYWASALALDSLFPKVSSNVLHLAFIGISINAVFQWIKVQNMVMGSGVLPSGSDLKAVVAGDSAGVILAGLPSSVLLGLFTGLGFVGVTIGRIAEELVKFAIFRHRMHRIDWDALAIEHGSGGGI
jgi:putative MATE family efflux protein